MTNDFPQTAMFSCPKTGPAIPGSIPYTCMDKGLALSMIPQGRVAAGQGRQYVPSMSVYLVRRETKKGARWHVRCELPGTPIIHLGVYETKTLADLRRGKALEDIALGRIPRRFTSIAPVQRTVRDVAKEWVGTLHDIADSTRSYYVRSTSTLPDWLADMDPDAVTYTDIQKHVADMSQRLKRGTIDRELAVLRMLLDNAGVAANPVRDKRVRLPRRGPKRMRLPSTKDIALLHEILPTRADLMTLLEHTGLRIHEAAALRWEDLDYTRDRLLVRESKTAAGRRWVDHLPNTPAIPTPETLPSWQPHDLVFRNPGAMRLTDALRAASINHGVPRFSAHDFRHLHASRLLHQGILSPAQIAARLGHANPGVTLSIYSHVVPPD